MTNDMVHWAQVSPGVGEAPGVELLPARQLTPGSPPAMKERKIRHRPNNGRIKRTDRNPPLAEPPWDLLRELNVPLPHDLACLPYTPVNWRRGQTYILWRRAVLAMWGDICHLCKHDQANTADHLVPISVWPNQPYSPWLARSAHGVAGCPTCHVPCNSSRGNRALALEIGNYKPPVAL